MIVQVVFATSAVQDIVPVELPSGSTVADAVRRSGLVEHHGLDLNTFGFAIFGRRAHPGTMLADGDRVELTRPLVVDPKAARVQRARRDSAAAPGDLVKRPRSG